MGRPIVGHWVIYLKWSHHSGAESLHLYLWVAPAKRREAADQDVYKDGESEHCSESLAFPAH